MALVPYFHHSSIRRYLLGFGSLFNDITVSRTLADDTVAQRILVPFAYGPKQSWVQRAAADPNLTKPISTTFPRIGYELTGMAYDGARKLQRTLKRVGDNNLTFVSAPWNIGILLTVFSINTDDGHQIIEQILPFFSPEFTITVNVLPELNITHDVPITLGSVTPHDSYDGGFGDVRLITWDLDFILKTHFYGPVSEQGVIRRVTADAHTGLDTSHSLERTVTVVNPEDANQDEEWTAETSTEIHLHGND